MSLGVVASVWTPLPTRTQQLPTLLARQYWELLRPFGHHCQHGRYNSQHRWPDKVGRYCVWLHVAYGVFPGHHIHVFRWHIRWDYVTRNARSHTKTPNLFCFLQHAERRRVLFLKKKKTLTQGSYSFHDLFKFSMKLGLVVTFKNFHNFPSLGVVFDLKQFNRHKLWCPPKCVPFTLFNYSSLPCIFLALSSAVTKLPNKTLILNSLKFHDFPGFPWPVQTLWHNALKLLILLFLLTVLLKWFLIFSVLKYM